MDKFDWLLASGDSVYGVSGPQVDHTLGTERGKYMLLDVSGGSAGDNAQLKSEELTYTYPRCFGFWYHMSGDNIGELRVSIRNMDTNDDTLLWKLNGPQTAGDAWKEGIVPLPEYPPAEIGQLVFEGIRGTGTHGDIAIDDTAMYTTPCDRVLPTEADPNTSSGNTGVIVGVVISFIMAITIVVVVIFIVVRRDELKV
ncbi:MAM domain-containing glycosylphosphatidylinositol anchor protein 2-like [Ptychodera flava]|uniref:MAM domain-containing glycosylphosphatidylinositol anchor protein 2-like n=1 Tax=Ptychodera flava TaxID=63121 RepID=UPI00396A594C